MCRRLAALRGRVLGRSHGHDPFALARAHGIPVSTLHQVDLVARHSDPPPAGTRLLGFYRRGEIFLSADLSSAERPRVLAHEIWHGFQPDDADGAAWCFARAFLGDPE